MKKVHMKTIDGSFIYGTFVEETGNSIVLKDTSVNTGDSHGIKVTFMKSNIIWLWYEDAK